MFPIVFISHGAPNTVLKNGTTQKNLKAFASQLERPQYIVVISSHWQTQEIEAIHPHTNELMYDFYGFERALYAFEYPIHNTSEVTQKVIEKLKSLNIKVNALRNSYDHGVWTALSMMYNTLDIPVIQLSLPAHWSAQSYVQYGEALKCLKNEALIVLSGTITHNLYEIDPQNQVPSYVKAFNETIKEALKKGDKKSIIEYETLKDFKRNHPSNEHFIPLLIALGASENGQAKSINSEYVYSTISMESYAFK